MLYLSTLKGLTREGSLETLAEVGHPGPGGDASEVCNRYQDVIAATPEGDDLRARYGQVLFIIDNQVRSQLEFPPPSSAAIEVPADTTDAGGGLASSSGEGGSQAEGQGDPASRGAAPQGGENGPATKIPENDEGSSAEGGNTNGGGTPDDAGGGDLLAGSDASPDAATPGAMSPKGKGKGK